MSHISRLRHYGKVLALYFSLSHQRATEYRIDYVLRLVRSVLEVVLVIVVILVFYSKIDSIHGWQRHEAMLVYGVFQLVTALVFTFVGFGINDLPRHIVTGKLDQYLLTPLDTQFTVSTKVAFITNIYRGMLGLGVVIYSLIQLQSPLNPIHLLITLVSLFAAAIIYYSLTFLTSTLAFWTFSEELPHVMQTITAVSRFPARFFEPAERLLYYFPLAFIATVPAAAILGKSTTPALLSPFVALVTFTLSRLLWKKGLESYQSASS